MPTQIDMADENTGTEELTESVEQLRLRLNAMKKIIDDPDKKLRRRPPPGNTIIDGSFLSVVFTVVLLMIICVSVYAFVNLYFAIVKKFHPKQHTEL
ncbi:hypothetical protein L9F63_026232 [Diploptera punctata]|uniref:Uncharacterized protein n=1 Tax=Diploptera punctata TaxID=6984 RepID=A0AAD8AL33_DIPPU|nr:hypothetical protein L9F63_026232 [Diploptera punctata]